MRTTTLLPLLALAAALGGRPAAQGAATAPAYDAEWIGYDTSHADQARWPQAMRGGDLDGDGDRDYAVVHGGALPMLTLHRNQGGGTFAAPVLVKTTLGAAWDDVRDLELGDLDHDGDLDVAVANGGNAETSNRLVVHENLGGGALAPFVVYTTGGGPCGVEIADVTIDGHADVITADYGYLGQGHTVSVLANDGSGALLPAVAIDVAESPWKLEAGDLDADGDQDLAVACEAETLTVLRNQGGLAFVRDDHPVFANPFVTKFRCGVALGDLDSDGDLDAAYTSNKCGFGDAAGTGAIGLLRNLGDGTLAPPIELETLPETQGGAMVALADWNEDGRLDVASAHEFDGEWLLFLSTGAAGFLPPQRFFTAASALAVDGGDVDGDGHPDAVVLGRNSLELGVYRNPGDGDFAQTPYHTFVDTAFGIFDPILSDSLRAADVDGDGDVDLGMAWANALSQDGGQALLKNQGDGTAFAQVVLQTPEGAANLAFSDLDLDGDPDLLSTDALGNRLRRRLNSGGAFGPEAFFTFGPVEDLETGDVDGDGDPDAVGVGVSTVFLGRNDGAGGFPAGSAQPLTTFVEVVALGDLDRDGDLDLFTDSNHAGCETSLNDGAGTFQAPIPVVTDWAPKGVALADLDRDGVLDAAVSCVSDDDHDHPTLQVLPGHGDGTFGLAATYLGSHQAGGGGNAGEVVASDPDGDGDLDLAVGNYFSNDVSFYENQGAGVFAPQVRFGTGPSTWGAAAADFDGDGFDDLAIGLTIGPSIDFFPSAAILPSNGTGAWVDLGFALKGVAGAPELDGSTPLAGGQPAALALAGARPDAAGAFVIGLAELGLPAFGGTLVPSLDVVVPLVTDAAGAAALSATWPAGLPPGFAVLAQAWTLDPAAEQGLSASNALSGTQL